MHDLDRTLFETYESETPQSEQSEFMSVLGEVLGELEAEALDPDVAHLLALARRYIAGQNVPMHALARQVRSIRGRVGTLPVRDLDLAVGAITNIDSHRRRAGLGPAPFGPPLRAAARARLNFP